MYRNIIRHSFFPVIHWVFFIDHQLGDPATEDRQPDDRGGGYQHGPDPGGDAAE
jgi:hypothetical protein